MENVILMCDSHHGQFIPQLMVENLINCNWIKLSDEQKADLQDPSCECYWDSWNNVLDNAKHVDQNGDTWFLHQDGDLFAYNDSKLTDEERENLFPEW